ncbi:TonB-dependent receptor [Emticicia agri]|uniref:TonB-dependent receptor n=1 Tax=Emticicia agri TaxID=2492393 RepID=A0A4Q5LYK3_9BACT|nr:TonB-dependent receptor [Emticicia agri]RYU94657.1 TonB-dependent receptor [Emticicia agri]
MRTALLGGVFLLLAFTAISQSRFSFSGTVTDAANGQPIPGVGVFFSGISRGALTDSSGKFSIYLPKSGYVVTVRALGYKIESFNINLNQNLTRDIKLNLRVDELAEVEVKATKEDRNIKETQMGVVKLEMKNLKKIPVVFGETDIIKALTLQPGITTVGEGAGGFNVRGGRVDQNLVLLDGMPIYNTSHLLGFLSSINSDALSGVTLYKGGIPAQYGGRLSSLLEMNTKSGNAEKLTGTVGVGLITSKVVLEGPILKDKITFMVAGRVAYPNFMINQFPSPTDKSKAFFYDLNGKLQYKINAKNILTLNSYRSFDNFKFADDTLYYAKTQTLSLQYSSLISKTLTLNVQGIYCNYDFGTQGYRKDYEFTLNSRIQHNELRAFALYTPKEQLKTEIGVNAVDYRINPGNLKPDVSTSSIITLDIPREYAREISPYINIDWSITPKISVQAGARYSTFQNLGPRQVFDYAGGQTRTTQSITDSVSYGKNQLIKQYGGIEPRLSMRFAFTKSAAIKLSYIRMRQYLHLISNTTAISPVDFWKVSDKHIPPQTADQLSIGIFKNFKDNTYETSVEAYYKDIQNLVEYKNGARLYFNPNIETELVQAIGKAYGIEGSIQKNKGRLKGSLSYTYSRTLARVDSEYPTEQVNGGQWFPSTFDKPHNLALSIQHFISNGWTFSTNFVYASGRPATYPDRTYRLLGKTVIDYSARNLDRIPQYHRLDMSLLKDTRKTPEQKKYYTFSLSFYNIYGRRNPYSIYFVRYNNSIRSYRLSVFGNIIPAVAVTYNF